MRIYSHFRAWGFYSKIRLSERNGNLFTAPSVRILFKNPIEWEKWEFIHISEREDFIQKSDYNTKWIVLRLSFNQAGIQNLHEIDAVFKGICTRLMQNLKKTARIWCKNGYKLRVKDIYLIKPYARKEWNRLLKQHLIQGKAAWRRNQKSPYMPLYCRIKQSPKPQVSWLRHSKNTYFLTDW